MPAQIGHSVVISKSTDGGNTWTTVSIGQASNVKFANSLSDITTGPDAEYLAGVNSCELSIDGVFTDDKLSAEFITDLKAGTKQTLKVTFVSGLEVQGDFLAESVDLKIDAKEAVKFSASLKSTGAVSITNVPTS